MKPITGMDVEIVCKPTGCACLSPDGTMCGFDRDPETQCTWRLSACGDCPKFGFSTCARWPMGLKPEEKQTFKKHRACMNGFETRRDLRVGA